MRRALALAAALAACAPAAHTPASAPAPLPRTFAHAFELDSTGDAPGAVRAYLDVTAEAARADGDPWQVPALEASLDALVTRELPTFGEFGRHVALAQRTHDSRAIAAGLSAAAAQARGSFARGLIERALTVLAQRAGHAEEAERARTASGCARAAVVVGPTSWSPITGVREPDALDRADAPLATTYAADGAFDTTAHATWIADRGCGIELSAESGRPGVRDVVVDLKIARAQTIGVVLRAHGPAILRAGGTEVLVRPFELGDGEAARFVRLTVSGGDLRLVARVGTAKEDDTVEIDVFGDDGAPLRAVAPAVGSSATGRVLRVQSTTAVSSPHAADDETLLAAAAALAEGSPHEAEGWLWSSGTRGDLGPDLALLAARAVGSAQDLSLATRAERARNDYERAVEASPHRWEALVGHAVLAGSRRGHDEAGIETLRDLDELRAKAPPSAGLPLLDAFEALTAGREKLFDRARAALARAHAALADTDVFAAAEKATSPRIGRERVAIECDRARPGAQDDFACFDALRAVGDRPRETFELRRLRAVLGAPARFLPLELRESLVDGDEVAARRTYEAMLPAERTLSALALLRPKAEENAAARARLLALARTARDAPASIGPLLRAIDDDPAREFDGVAERIAAADRAQPILPSAGTAVLAHVERYDVTHEGLVHWTLFDERRVSGTTDVEENAQAPAPDLWGRGATRPVRRRILKRDGRVLEPERTPGATQAHADLSQLEQGDIVEALYEGWALPGDTGDIGIDTPDLLPDRTAVHDATIELRTPVALAGALWAHPLLGKAVEQIDGDVRVRTWHVVDHPARRIEDGVPKMDRSVSVSFSTARWERIARALRETIAALDEHDPEISAWARAAVATVGDDPRAQVEALVTAAGKAVREADPGTLSDYGGGVAPVQSETARTFVASHDGSRAWLVLRSLRELGIGGDLAVAENDPFSADASYPPHYGRFVHPLVIAHIRTAAGPEDVWIDADVAGPPLPAGRVSPELRGRLVLTQAGVIQPLPELPTASGSSHGDRDEVDVRLALDPAGSARGTFAVVLRGREAQELAEALLRSVGAERQRALREVVLAWLPWANVDDVQLASTEGSWQVSLRADVSVSGYAQIDVSNGHAGRTWRLPGLDPLHWAWPRARVSNLAATFATHGGRESALAVSSAVQYHVHRRIELPRGAVVDRAPGPIDLRGKLLEAARRMTMKEGVLEDDFVLSVATGTVAPGDYDAFVASAHQADDGFLASTRVAIR